MILQDEYIIIKINGQVFYSHEPDTAPTEFDVGIRQGNRHHRLDEIAIEGWYDGVSVRRTSEPRPTSHGDFKTNATMSSRVITITGIAVANNAWELQHLRDGLMSIGNDGQYHKMEVYTTSTGVRYTEVGLEGKPQWTRKTDKYATFKIDLFAPDPHIYGPELTWTFPGVGFNGGMDFPITYPLYYGVDDPYEIKNVENDGNADAWPKISVFGNTPEGFTITDGKGNRVIYEGPVGVNAPVVVDFAKGTAYQNGINQTSKLTSREWFPIPPRWQAPVRTVQPRLEYSLLSGQGWMVVAIRDTWI